MSKREPPRTGPRARAKRHPGVTASVVAAGVVGAAALALGASRGRGDLDAKEHSGASMRTEDAPPPGPVRRFLDVPDGPTIAYAEAGEGPDLILIHGALTALDDMWFGPMEALSRHFHVVAVDRPGHGESEHVRLTDASVWRQAEIVRRFGQVLGLERPVVVGHSFGGAVALACGMAFPDEIAGIVAVSPICFPEPRLEQMLFGPRAVPFAGDAVATMMRGSDAALLPVLWRAMFLPQSMPARFEAEFPFELTGRADRLVADGENANMLWSDLSRSALGYATCRAPVHILCGSADIVTNPLMHGRQAAWLIPGARFTWLLGLGHMLHHFQPDAVADAALEVAGR